MSIINITKDNFAREVTESKQPVLLDFWAEWCGHCHAVSPVIDEIAAEHPEIKVGKVNVDEQRDLAEQFRIMSIPALLVLKDGQVVNRAVGAQSKQCILNMF